MTAARFSAFFRRATALVMTALTACSAGLFGTLLSLPPESRAALPVPGMLEAVLGALTLYLAAAVVTAQAKNARGRG